ncbi:MAG: TIGR03915 family putative DNA repair protein [Ferruginibacter sp.]
MTTVAYDGTYEGLFSAIFEIYEYRFSDVEIYETGFVNTSFFGGVHLVHTDAEKSKRVYKKLEQRISAKAMNNLYKAFLSGEKKMPGVLLRLVQYVLASKVSVECDYNNADILWVQQMSRKVDREKHRMEAFVRFQLAKDELYYAIVQPDYNVLPLISNHFEKRYAGQRWLIYDSIRKYGIYYDLHKVETVEMTFNPDMDNEGTITELSDPDENLYQQLWQQYFTSINIKARKNMKLHLQHIPRRYWKFLTEKKLL